MTDTTSTPDDLRRDAGRGRRWPAAAAATAVLAVVAVGLRLSLVASTDELRWDEIYMQPVVEAIVTGGWTVEHAIDYADTKGPAFFWTCAALAEVIGSDIESLRLINLAFFVLAGIPLGLLAARCGMSWRGGAVAAAALYAILPYNAVLGQLFMSETSFLAGSLCLALSFIWGFGRTPASGHRVAGPLVFGILLAVLLHHRPHVLAYAAAAVLVATERDGRRSWPWWAACAGAVLLRVPLYLRWGGLVSPEYHDLVGIGLRLDSLTYLAISLLPCTFVFLAALVLQRARGRTEPAAWRWVGGAALAGLALGLFAAPDLGPDPDGGRTRYLGMVATTLRGLAPGVVPRAAFAVLAALGTAAIAAAGVLARRAPLDEPGAGPVLDRLAAWTMLLGWLMYGLTRGDVYDRYLLAFVALVPLLWIRVVPRWLLVVLGLALAAMIARLASSHGLLS